MGSFTPQVQKPQNGGSGKGFSTDSSIQFPIQQPPDSMADVMPPPGAPKGKGGSMGAITFPGDDGQPKYGAPNQYSNTVGPWDNQPNQNQAHMGKGKGA